ncbi:hypothetical protein R1flu_008440 [Riccia fluitans]|uniref:Uncharacterized protein n=1 Tax=Riccia fluitans TaxID=41844 RepID=A0ABD1YBX2_9MARC
MILAYLRGLRSRSYNWAKAILHGLRTEILFLRSRACNNEDGKTIPVVWTPCFVHILFGLRCTLFVGTPLEEAEGSRCKLPEEIPIASPEQPVSCQRPEEIPIASPKQPMSSKRPHAEDKERGLPSIKKNKTNDGLRGQVAAKDAEKSDVHALARTEVQHELEELKRSGTELEDFKRSMTANEKAAKETHLQKLALVHTELEEYKQSSEASIKRLEEEALRLREALVAKESVV